MAAKKYILGLIITTATLATLTALLWLRTNDSNWEKTGSSDLVAELYGRFDPKKPGFGAADYPGNAAVHIPKSYAAILFAEVERSRGDLLPQLPNLAATAGNWLLDHADLDKDGQVGWGVPIAWDAYGDGSENPANTTYTISTAIVVDALLTWMERDSSSPKQRIFDTVTEALRPFAGPKYRSPSGLLPYSFRSSDLPYDTFNPAAYMAGQLQRFSQLTPDQPLATALRQAADDTVQVLLNEKKINPATGSWYWQYSIQESVANDLPHASYIIDGLRTYRLHGGRLADRIDMNAVLNHLHEFHDKAAGHVRAWPLLQQNIDRAARTYDLGMAMSLACAAPETASLAQVFQAEIPKYRDGRNGYLKYPAGSNYAPPLIVNEYEAYLYRGAIDCRLLAARQRSASFGIDLRPVAGRIENGTHAGEQPPTAKVAIPFVNPAKTASSTVSVQNLERNSYLLEEGQQPPLVFESALPVASHPFGNGRVVFVRHLISNQLKLVVTDSQGERLTELRIRHSDGSEPMYRASLVDADRLFLLYYDNVTLNNYLAQYRVDPTGVHPVRPPVRLPLLGDPAGGNYEMIPPAFLMPIDGDQLAIVGGTLSATFSLRSGTLTERRVDNCLKILEAIPSPDGAVILCQKKSIVPGEATFIISAPTSLTVPRIDETQIPYNIRVHERAVDVDLAADVQSLTKMLRFDLARIQQNGWMEFGTNNDEGRIPWSQLYYLNGMLDFIKLGASSDDMRPFSEIIAELRMRLDLELRLVDEQWRNNRIVTRGFTVARSPAVFAVQTSRLLLIMQRYLTEVQHPIALPAFDSLQRAVHCLDDHIDVLSYGGAPVYWMKPHNANLRWPYGSAFYFDGLPVPYNHQNEWAYSVTRTEEASTCPGTKFAGLQIIDHFMRHVAPSGVFPNAGRWDYWWGTALDGWSAADNVSKNKPYYSGDKSKAWISFRTIDLMSVLAHSEQFDPSVRSNLLMSARHQIYTGKVYPFANYELLRAGLKPLLASDVARQYVRVTSPWELQSAAWAFLALAAPTNQAVPHQEK